MQSLIRGEVKDRDLDVELVAQLIDHLKAALHVARWRGQRAEA